MIDILTKLKKLFDNLFIGVKKSFHHNRKNVKKTKQKAGPNSQQAGRDIKDSHDTYNIKPSQLLVMNVPLIGEQAKVWFNEHMKAYGCPGGYIPFKEQCVLSPKFLEEVSIARNEFIKWAQDNSPDGIQLPPYKECNDKAKQLWNKYVKSPKYKDADDL